MQLKGILLALLLLEAPSGYALERPAFARQPRADSSSSIFKVNHERLVSRADLIYTQPVTRSEAGMPIGNGKMGSLVWTTPTDIRFQVNRVDVFGNSPASNNFYQRNTDYCGGVGFVDIHFPEFGDVFSGENFRQHLSCYGGQVSLEGKGVKAEILASQEHDVFAVRVDDSRDGPQVINIKLRMLRDAVSRTGNHAAVTKVEARGDRILLIQKFTEDDYYNGSAIVVGTRGKKVKARLTNEREVQLTAEAGQGSFEIYIASAATFDPEADVAATAERQLDEALEKGFEAVSATGKEWWRRFWERSFVHLQSDDGVAGFIAENYYYYLYVMAASSRGDYPVKFNGMLWTTGGDARQWGAAFWGANQSCLYNALLAANHPELMDPMFNMYSSAYDSFSIAARQQWRSKGVYIPETMAFSGVPRLPEPIAGEMSALYLTRKPWDQRSEAFTEYAFTKMPYLSRWNWKKDGGWENGRWQVENKGGGPFGHVSHIFSRGAKIAYQYWQRFEYTLDSAWLEQYAYPMLKGVAEFYRNFPNVKKEKDGKYHIYQVNDNESLWGGHNTVEELSSMHGIFPAVIRAAEILGKDAAMKPVWEEFLANLSPLPLSSDYPSHDRANQQPVWIRSLPPVLQGNGDRHPDPNTMPVWFFDLANLENPDRRTLDIANATFDTYFPRGINEETYPYVLSRLPVIGATLGRKEAVRFLLPNQIRRGPDHEVLPNRMDLSEGYYTTNVQRLGRAAEALQYALCQSTPSGPGKEPVIRVFPAWPEEWDAQYTLLCRGDFLVTASKRDKTIEFVEVLSGSGSVCRVRNPWPGKSLTVYRNGRKLSEEAGSLITFDTAPGDRFILVRKGSRPEKYERELTAER